ncbi:transcriptional regulator MET31 [Favolaschia claudopus]|uniref:Transcriptional regulator MET31 n=1 Tax=Favolaschia claudopus TaxID=2862362 RepID=A0AAW0AAF7_9AGAR
MDSRYSYPSPPFSDGSNSPPSSGYSQPYEESSGRPYYPPASSSTRGGGHYYPPIAPAPPSDRYSGYPRSSANYSNPPGYPSASQYPDNRESGYPSNPPPSSSSYQFNARSPSPGTYQRQPQPRNFIPTPSEAYANPARPPRSSSMPMPAHSNRAGGSYAPAQNPSSSRTRNPMCNHASSSHSTERYTCEVCGRDFSRAHDRKRHHETQHATSPVTHKCPFCKKDFSRADSLKRHLQNGCDEAPQQ